MQLKLFDADKRLGHFPIWYKSESVKKTMLALVDAPGNFLTTAQIHERTGSMAVHSDIDALRANGFDIPPAIYCGKNPETRRKMYGYRLLFKSF